MLSIGMFSWDLYLVYFKVVGDVMGEGGRFKGDEREVGKLRGSLLE